MQLLVLTFSNPLNTSLQIGDVAYYSTVTTVPNSGFSTLTADPLASPTIIQLGVITNIDHSSFQVSVMFDETLGTTPPSEDDYIMFGKNKKVNSSSMVGYYARVDFKNDSTEKIELFSIGSEFSESSK